MGKKKGNGASSVFPERCVAVEGRKEVAMPVNTASGSRKNLGSAPVPSSIGQKGRFWSFC